MRSLLLGILLTFLFSADSFATTVCPLLGEVVSASLRVEPHSEIVSPDAPIEPDLYVLPSEAVLPDESVPLEPSYETHLPVAGGEFDPNAPITPDYVLPTFDPDPPLEPGPSRRRESSSRVEQLAEFLDETVGWVSDATEATTEWATQHGVQDVNGNGSVLDETIEGFRNGTFGVVEAGEIGFETLLHHGESEFAPSNPVGDSQNVSEALGVVFSEFD